MIRAYRYQLEIHPVYKRVDTCAAEFPASTAYMYSSYEEECEARVTNNEKIMVLGGGPNRIGQGIEFDYCCVHAALAMREDQFETIMVNCNPETVSTDYDTSDRLYFEPITFEDILEIIRIEKPKGVIVQFGGQTPLKLARDLEKAGVPIIGTTPEKIDQAEDRERFQVLIDKLNLKQPPNGIVRTIDESLQVAEKIGYPLVVRPSYVLGGRAMEIVYGTEELEHYMRTAVQVSNDSPVLLDSFLNQAVEIDVDAVSDGETVIIGAIMQHVEEAGVHSGDSSCSLPPFDLSSELQEEVRKQVKALALALGVVGLMNVQLAVRNNEIYILEVNPRASRTVPFVSKAIGVSLAKVAARVMAGKTLAELNFTQEIIPNYYSLKQAVFPFKKFQGVDPILGPEMRSTGEVMGIGENFAEAFASAMLSIGDVPPVGGHVILSVRDADKAKIIGLAQELIELGFILLATKGTAKVLQQADLPVQVINKVADGSPHIVDIIKERDISYIINTTEGKQAITDSAAIRSSALEQHIYYSTTLASAQAVCMALRVSNRKIRRLQDLHEGINE